MEKTPGMRANQQIFRVRREYNQWVANQTLEDYALRFTAKSARRWSAWEVCMTALGATAFLALEAIGGAITLNYGFTNALWAILSVGLVIFITGFPISYYAARHGVDIDLLTRGAGFGYLGSTITSLIYAAFTFIFFAIEAAILALALKALFGIPLALGYVLCAIAVIPIVTHGITAISKFQLGSQTLWLTLQIMALAAVAWFELDKVGDWSQYQGIARLEGAEPGFNLALFGAASAMMFALVAQIGEQVDYLRFLPPSESIEKRKWWGALLLAGPGWILIGIVKMLAGSFLAWLAFSGGTDFEAATDPTLMYQAAFNYLTESPAFSLALAGVMVIVSQMKINVTNAYAGSIAWSNFFSRVTHSHPGRVVWLVFNVLIALLLMELGIYQALENTLGMFAIVAVSWLGTISADLTINQALGLRPRGLEFKRAHLYDINPVGIGSMSAAAILGLICYFGLLGPEAQALAHYVTLLTTFVTAPLLAWYTRGRYYIARQPEATAQDISASECCICENTFEQEDISYCPAYLGSICSLCCSLDSRCMDSCKPGGELSQQLITWMSRILPSSVAAHIDSRISRYLGVFSFISLLNGALFILVYYHMSPVDETGQALVASTLWTLFFVFTIITGVVTWLFLLTKESRIVAHEESNRQTQRLMSEIEAHRVTDKELQEAKDSAEAANQAKSRYLAGISHELRTPLQSILGYAQILSRDKDLGERRRESIDIVRRSGEYLADLIEGLLDISRIEAGKLEIQRNQVDLASLLDELVDMFSLSAAGKSVQFEANLSDRLPHHVIADGTHLRQILTNLLSNAIKFTEQGKVIFTVNYRNQVAEFIIEDTGVGIEQGDRERIFNPFERVYSGSSHIPGTGLGLTIVKLLVEMMGGDITLDSTPGEGSRFTLLLMLSSISQPSIVNLERRDITGYEGEPRSIMVVDDEPYHRQLIIDLMKPLGFFVHQARDGKHCLDLVSQTVPDIFLVDVSMPGMTGLDLVRNLRQQEVSSPIIMISADAQERHGDLEQDALHDDFMVKPIKLRELLQSISKQMDIVWRYRETSPRPALNQDIITSDTQIPQHQGFDKLLAFAEIGYLNGVQSQIKELRNDNNIDATLLDQFDTLARSARLEQIAQILQERL